MCTQCLWAWISWYTHGNQRTTLWSSFFPSIMWIPDTEFQVAGLEPSLACSNFKVSMISISCWGLDATGLPALNPARMSVQLSINTASYHSSCYHTADRHHNMTHTTNVCSRPELKILFSKVVHLILSIQHPGRCMYLSYNTIKCKSINSEHSHL